MAPLRGLTDLYQSVPSPANKADGHTESQGGPVWPGFGTSDPEVPMAYWAGPPPNAQQVYGSPLADAIGPPADGVEGPASLIDKTPGESDSHAAPYPRTIGYGNTHDPDEQIAQQEARRAIHGQDLGGPEKVRTAPDGQPFPATWDYGQYVATGETELVGGLPPQVASSPLGGSGNAKNRIDSTQGLGELGGYGSGSAHVQRASMVDPVPYNRQWLNSSDRPIMVPRRGYQASFDGQDSPYGRLGDTTNDMLQGTDHTAVMTMPTPYNDPPNPATAPAGSPGGEAPMINSWF